MYRVINASHDDYDFSGYHPYTAPRGPESASDKDWVAKVISDFVKRTGRCDRESIIERFRDMNEDYDDWWARGLRTHEAEQEFLDDLARRCKEDYGVTIQV